MINSESIQKLIRQFANQCPMVNDCNFGSVYDINTTENKFGLLNVELISCANKSNVMVYTYNIFYVDRLSEANSNKDQIWDDSVRAIKWLLNSLKSYDLAQIDIVSDYTFQFFSERFGDECAGAWVEVQLEAPNETGECFEDIKFTEPTLPPRSKSVTFDKNGIYQITPDEGYLLDLVEVKVNVNVDEDIDAKVKEHNKSSIAHQDIREDIDDIKDNLNNKVTKEAGKGLSSNDYTNEDKNKLNTTEQISNKVTVIDENSTDIQYPSAFATKRYVEEAKKLLFIDMWNQACGENGRYNKETGFFELININDITYEEALGIYRVSTATANPPKNDGVSNMFMGLYQSQGNYRAFIPPRLTLHNTYSINSLYSYCNELREVIINSYKGESIAILHANVSFCDCFKLTDVFSILYCRESGVKFIGAFRNCYALRNILIRNLQVDIDFQFSSELSNNSILYMITNSNIKEPTTKPFTITLHSDAYTRALADTEILAALAAQSLITLVSA